MKRIDTATRRKMIELHKEGKEIKEIHQILNNANIKISYGSTWNQVDQSPIPDALIRDHYSLPVHEPLSTVSKSGPSGCPLSRFILQEEIPEIKDSGLGSLSIPQEKKANDQPTIKNTITNDPEEIDILDTDSEPDIYTDPNADYDEQYDGDPLNPLQRELDSNWQVTAVDILRAIRQGKNLDSIQQ